MSLSGAPAGCKASLAKPKELSKEMAQRLAEIPPDGKIPDNMGDDFANKILIRCQ